MLVLQIHFIMSSWFFSQFQLSAVLAVSGSYINKNILLIIFHIVSLIFAIISLNIITESIMHLLKLAEKRDRHDEIETCKLLM